MMEQPLSDESKRKILWDNSGEDLRGKADSRSPVGEGLTGATPPAKSL